MAKPWDRWYHCVCTTYGAWLQGDRRGFRERHHRRHVEGDYRAPPPPGRYEALARHTKRSMKHPPVVLSATDRIVVCRVMAETLLAYKVELIDLCVGGEHFHMLCRFPLALPNAEDHDPGEMPGSLLTDGRDPVPRHITGRAKRAASVALGRIGRKPQGAPLWAKRCKFEPIASRRHQLAVVRYIRKHVDAHAALWSELQRTEEPTA